MNPLTDILLPELFIYMSSFLSIQTKCYSLQLLNRAIHQAFDPIKLCRKDTLSFSPSFEQHVEEYQSSSLSQIMSIIPAVRINVKSLQYLKTLEREPLYKQTIDYFFSRLAQSVVGTSQSVGDPLIVQCPQSTLRSFRFVEHVCHSSQKAYHLNDLVNEIYDLIMQPDEQLSNDIQSIDQLAASPMVTLDDLYIQVVDNRSYAQFLENPIEWIDIGSMLFSDSITTLFLDLPHGFAARSEDRINIVCDLPSSLTSVTLKIGFQTRDIPQLNWYLERADTLPIVKHLDFGVSMPTNRSLSTITTTGSPRPFESLKLVFADDSLRYGSFEHVLKFELMFTHEWSLDQLSVLAEIDAMPLLKSFHLNWSPDIAFEIEEISMSCDLSSVMIFLSKRPLENINLSIDSTHTTWAPLSDAALQSLKDLKTMTHFYYRACRDNDEINSDELAILPFESENLQNYLPVGCWPLLQSLKLHEISPVDDITTLVRAAPALKMLVFGPHDDQVNNSNWMLRYLELIDRYCPKIERIECTTWKFHPFSEQDHQAAASIHLNLRHLTRLDLTYTRLDDKALHLLLSKICHAPITDFQANDKQSKLRLMLRHVLTHLKTLALSSSDDIMFPEFYQFQDRNSCFPFMKSQEHSWLYTFSQVVNDNGENGRTAFFRMMRDVLSEEEVKQLTDWDMGHYF